MSTGWTSSLQLAKQERPQALTVEAKASGSIVPSARDLRKESSAYQFFTLPILSLQEHPQPEGHATFRYHHACIAIGVPPRMTDDRQADRYSCIEVFRVVCLMEAQHHLASDAPRHANYT